MGNTSIRGDLGVDVTAFALVQVDLSLQDVDLLRLHLELLPKVLFEILHLLLLRIVIVNKDGLVRRVQLTVQILLVLALLANHIQQVRILLNRLSQLTLNFLEFSFLILYVADALLLALLVLLLLIKHGLRGTTDLQRVQIDQVTKPQHLTLVIFTFAIIPNFLVLVDFLALLGLLSLRFSLLFLKLLNLVVKLTLTLNKLQELLPRE